MRGMKSFVSLAGITAALLSCSLGGLDEADPNATLESVADAIVDGPARVAAYNLQALCRLYASEADFFGKMRDDFKGLEDVIGAYDKWKTVL